MAAPRGQHMTVSEGVYSSWRAIGLTEGLHTDSDIAQLLVTLYSSGKQREGEESSLRCVDCHCPLTLYCSTCHHPSHLTLPPQPPPPSLSSPPPPPPPQVSDSSAPASVPTHTDHSPDWQQLAAVTDVKDEGDSDDTLPANENHESDESSFHLDAVKTESVLSACGYESITDQPDAGASLRTSSRDERRKSQRLVRKSAATSKQQKKKRKATAVQLEKARKKKHSDKKQTMTNGTEKVSDVKGNNKTAEDISLKHKGAGSRESAGKKVSDTTQSETERNSRNVTSVGRRNERQRKRKPCASQDLEDGFILSVEERSSAQIHVYDESFHENHTIEDEPPKRPGRPRKKSAGPVILKHASERPGRGKRKRTRVDTLTAAGSDCGSSDEEVPSHQRHTFVEQEGSASKTGRAEDDESFRQPLRVLVSAQKILPLRTTTGNYAHHFYSYFECFHCKKAFVHKRAFNSHVQTHIGPKEFKCALCGKGFKRSCDRMKHERRHKLECGFCGKKFANSRHLEEHSKLHTENNGVIKCSGCAFETSDFHGYEKHRSKCTVVQCEVCGVRLKSRFALRFHIAAVHDNHRPYKCALCQKTFVLQTNLNSHVKYRHAEGGRPFHCDQCDYRAFDPRALAIHQRCVHSSERPFQCSHCPSAFARKFYLVVHLRRHTGEKPHRCVECSQAFTQKVSLTRHRRRAHHGLEPATGHPTKTTEP